MGSRVVNQLANIIAGFYLRKVEAFLDDPLGAQHECWKYLVENLRKTEYGRRYGSGHVLNYEAFSRNFPVVDYEDLSPWIQRMREGAENVLWPGRTTWFARSSGTTGSVSKYIPVTDDVLQRCHYRGGYDVLSFYVKHDPSTRFYLGKGLTLGGSHQMEENRGQSREGDLSAILLQNIPSWADLIRVPSREVALTADWTTKLEGIARECMNKPVTSITGVPSWNLVMLHYLLEVSGKSTIGELWPDLEVFFHGGVSFVPYREEFNRTIGLDGMRYMESYNASEGYFGLQDDLSVSDMLLMLDYGVFYEFIDMEDFFSDRRAVIPLEGVRTGRNYALVISSTNGLIRYVIGDTITFTSVDPYRFRLTGRTKLYINAFGEEVIIDNAERALVSACALTGAELGEYTAAPVFMAGEAKGCHEWFLEFRHAPMDLVAFRDALDAALQGENSDYAAKRNGDVTLGAPQVCSLPAGTFLGWMDSRGRMGGQNKVPRLSNDRGLADDLLAYVMRSGLSVDRV